MKTRTSSLFLLGVAVLGFWPGAWAQDPGEESDLSVAAIQSSIATLRADEELDEATRAGAVEFYEQALALLAKTNEHVALGVEHDRAAEQAPQRLTAIRAKLSTPPGDPEVSAPPGASVAQIEQLRAGKEAELATVREQVGKLRAESARRAERQSAASEQIARATHEIDEVLVKYKAQPLDGGSPELNAARGVMQRARYGALRAEITTLKKELASYDVRSELLPSRLDWARRQESVAEEAVSAWQELAAERRRVEAELAARDAERRLREEVLQKIPQLLKLATENQRLAASRAGEDGLSAQLAAVGTELTVAKERLARLRESFRRVRRKVRVAGVTNAMGRLLRRRLEELPDPSVLNRASASRQDRMADLQYKLIVLEEDRAEAGDVERRLDTILAPLAAAERDRLDEVVRELLTTHRDLLDALISDKTLIFNRLVELDQATRLMVQGSQEYSAYVEERILWIRSVPGGALPSPSLALAAVVWLVDPSEWASAVGAALGEMRRRPFESVTWVLLVVLLFGVYPWSRRAAKRAGESVWKPDADAFHHTLRAVVLVLCMSLPLPLLLWGLGVWLALPSGQGDFGHAIGAGFKSTGLLLLGLEFMRQILRDGGLGSVHFRWRSTGTKHLRLHLRWFLPTACVTAFLVESLDATHDPALNDSLGRIAFLVSVVALAVFVQRVLRPSGPTFAIYLQRNKGGWLERLRYLWYPAAVGLPLVLGILAAQGFYFSARQLLENLRASFWLVIGLLLINALLLRWLRLTRSRLVLQQIAAHEAAEKEAAKEAAKEEKARKAKAAELAAAAAEEESSEEKSEADGEVSPEVVFETSAGKKSTRSVARPRADPRSTGGIRRADITHARIMAAHHVKGRDERSALNVKFEEALDHAAISTQLRRLFGTVTMVVALLGLLAVWADVMPALKRLDQVQVWPTFEYVDAAEVGELSLDQHEASTPAADVPVVPEAVTGLVPTPQLPTPAGTAIPERVSLADIALSLIIFLFTYLATKNIPGLLEFLLLERASVDAGARYAVSTVARYAIVVFGVSFGFGVVGFRWDSIQWLAAALTFGLAFGLQAIFANFVSGLIILFERPVSLGDWVTVDGVTGIVTRIRIRATTVTDLDRRELIVPNQAFVTANVINWALTDSVLRLVIPVGVAYGSDTGKVRELLLQIAGDHSRVLEDPAPRGLFRHFGANSLEFELHAYVDHPIHAWDVRHDLLESINAEFAAGGLEIAFPQHDLHLRSADPGLLSQLGVAVTQPPKS